MPFYWTRTSPGAICPVMLVNCWRTDCWGLGSSSAHCNPQLWWRHNNFHYCSQAGSCWCCHGNSSRCHIMDRWTISMLEKTDWKFMMKLMLHSTASLDNERRFSDKLSKAWSILLYLLIRQTLQLDPGFFLQKKVCNFTVWGDGTCLDCWGVSLYTDPTPHALAI